MYVMQCICNTLKISHIKFIKQFIQDYEQLKIILFVITLYNEVVITCTIKHV